MWPGANTRCGGAPGQTGNAVRPVRRYAGTERRYGEAGSGGPAGGRAMWKRRMLLLLLWALSLTGITLYGGTVSYGFFFAVTFIPAVCWIYLISVYFCFKVYQEIGTRNVVSGEPVPYYFVLQNENRFAFAGVSVKMHEGLSYVEELPENSEYELLPKQKYKYETKLVCRYRGEYGVGVREVVVTDFFRLFRLRYKVREGIKALVRPRIWELEGLGCLKAMQELPWREAYGQRTEPDVTVRDYMSGDAMKQVHWKSTARTGQLKVRERTGEEKKGVALFFDTGRTGTVPEEYLPPENRILEIVLAVSLFWAKRRVACEVYYSQGGINRHLVSGLSGFEVLYEHISAARFTGEESAEAGLADAAAKGAFEGSSLVFMAVQKADGLILSAAEKLQKRGSCVVIYEVSREPGDTESGSSLFLRRVSPDENLKDALE